MVCYTREIKFWYWDNMGHGDGGDHCQGEKQGTETDKTPWPPQIIILPGIN